MLRRWCRFRWWKRPSTYRGLDHRDYERKHQHRIMTLYSSNAPLGRRRPLSEIIVRVPRLRSALPPPFTFKLDPSLHDNLRRVEFTFFITVAGTFTRLAFDLSASKESIRKMYHLGRMGQRTERDPMKSHPCARKRMQVGQSSRSEANRDKSTSSRHRQLFLT